jgi:hypothetical protein
MLNVVIIDNTNRAISGGYEDNMTIAYSIYVGAGKIGTMARRFPRAVFTFGADAATWSSNKYFDHYVTADVMGIAETGRNVASGVHLFEKLGGHRYFDGDWRYKHDEVAVDAVVSNIGNDIRYGCVTQSGARLFEKEIYADEVGIISSGAADSSGRRINTQTPMAWATVARRMLVQIAGVSSMVEPMLHLHRSRRGAHASMAEKTQINQSNSRGIISPREVRLLKLPTSCRKVCSIAT